MLRALAACCLSATLVSVTGTGCRRSETGPVFSPPATPPVRPAQGSGASDGPPQLSLERGGVPQSLSFVKNGDIWLARPGDSFAVLIAGGGDCHSPAWSRDGRRLAYVRDRPEKLETGLGEEPVGEIWTCDEVGGSSRKIAQSTEGGLGPGISAIAWDPDGMGLVVMAGLAAVSGGAWHVTLEGVVTGSELACNALQAVEREGAGFAVVEHNYTRGYGAEEVFLINSDLTRVAYATEMTDLFPVFSPDCKRAVVIEAAGEPAQDPAQRKDALLLVSDPVFESPDWLDKNARGDTAAARIAEPAGVPRRAVKLYESDRQLRDVTWSSDGQWLAFVASPREEGAGETRAQIWVLSVATREARPVVSGATQPAWKPEGGQ